MPLAIPPNSAGNDVTFLSQLYIPIITYSSLVPWFPAGTMQNGTSHACINSLASYSCPNYSMPAWLPACCSLYAVSTLVSPSTAIVSSSYYYDVLSTSPSQL